MSRASAGACISSAAMSSALARNFSGAVVRRGRGHHGRARRMRADAVLDAVGLAVGDADAPVVDAQHLGADLRHHGLEALAERRAAGDELDRAARYRPRCARHRRGPSPLFSTNIANPAPTASPAARRARQLGPELVPAAALPAACRAARHSRRNRARSPRRAPRAAGDRASRPARWHCGAARRSDRCRAWCAMASISRSRTNVVS